MGKLAFLVIDYSYAGGVERVTALLSTLFLKHGLQPAYLISLKAEFPEPYMEYPPALKTIVLKTGNDKPQLNGELTALLKEHNITRLIFQGDNMGLSFKILKEAAAANCEAYLHYHGSPYGYLKKYIYASDIRANPSLFFKSVWNTIVYPFKLLRVVQLVKKSNAGVVCVSAGVQQEILGLWPWSNAIKKRIHFVINPLSFTDVSNSLQKKENIIVYIGRLERRHKNTMLILEAWQKICTKFPDWKLLLAGHGRIEIPMKRYCEKHQIKNVLFAGLVNNIPAVLETSAISVLSSDCEGLGMGMMESAISYNALLSTKSDGGITDIITHGETGLLVPRNNAIDFAHALEVLMTKKDLREQLAIAAHDRVSQFSDAAIAAQWKTILYLEKHD